MNREQQQQLGQQEQQLKQLGAAPTHACIYQLAFRFGL